MVVQPRRQLGPALSGAISRSDDRVVVHLWGEIDITAEPELEACLGEALGIGLPLDVDMAGVSFLDLRGMRPLVHAAGDHEHAVTVRHAPRVLGLVLRAFGPLGERIVVDRP